MTGGAGHINDMISRMKNNRELLKKRRENYKQRLEDMNVSYGKKQSHKKATREELAAIQQKMKQQNARERRRMIYVFVIALVLTALLIYGLIVVVSNLTFPF